MILKFFICMCLVQATIQLQLDFEKYKIVKGGA